MSESCFNHSGGWKDDNAYIYRNISSSVEISFSFFPDYRTGALSVCDRQRRVTTAVHCDRRRSERAFQNKSTWARATNWCFFNYGLKTHFYSLQLFLLHYRHINTILDAFLPLFLFAIRIRRQKGNVVKQAWQLEFLWGNPDFPA